MNPITHVGIVKVLKGIIRYRYMHRKKMVRQFKKIKDDPHPDAVFFTCVDSRMLPTRFTQTNVGDMFIVRNAGNLVPHAEKYHPGIATTEPAVLELGCIVNSIQDVVVCGHSDCKAINLLYQLRDPKEATNAHLHGSPLRAWLHRNALSSLVKFQELEQRGFNKAMEFRSEQPMRNFVAYIDPENKFSVEDKLSQVNTLQQVENIASYNFLKSGLVAGSIEIHAFWFDIYTGDLYYFSRRNKQFIDVNETTIDDLIDEVK